MSKPPQAKKKKTGICRVESVVSDVSDTDLLNVLERLDLTEPCYVSENIKSALLSAVSNTVNLWATNFNTMPTCKCIPYSYPT